MLNRLSDPQNAPSKTMQMKVAVNVLRGKRGC